jgi:hypothetical protein
VLRETTSLCELVCPSHTNERGGHKIRFRPGTGPCVFITAVPITKLFTRGGEWRSSPAASGIPTLGMLVEMYECLCNLFCILASAGAGPAQDSQPAVWHGAAVLRRLWPPSPCRGAAPYGLLLVAGGGGWCCCCGASPHAVLSVAACNRGPPSSAFQYSVASASMSGLSHHVLPRRLWRAVGWVGYLSGVIGGVETGLLGGVLPRISVGTWGLCVRLCLVLVCMGRYCLGGGFFSSFWDRVWAE